VTPYILSQSLYRSECLVLRLDPFCHRGSSSYCTFSRTLRGCRDDLKASEKKQVSCFCEI